MSEKEKIKISKIAKMLSIKVPTAKSILYHYRKTGKILKVK